MYEKFLALLVAKFAQARKDGLQQMARSLSLHAADETEAQALVDKLQETQVTDFIKNWRKEVDTEVSRSTKTYEENLKSKYDLVEKKTPTPPNVPKNIDPSNIAEVVAAAVAQAVAPLQDKIAGFETGRTAETRKDVLLEKLSNAPEVFKNSIVKSFDRMTFESQEEFDTFIEETVADAKTMEQTVANNGLGLFPTPNSSSKKVEAETANSDIENWAKSNKKD